MACQTVQMWSLSGLVAAFLDLAIAYLLLCASAVAYVASKFLDFFGLNLPCPCEGMFFNIHSKSLCLNTLLVDFPAQKVSDVQLSARQNFPFGGSKHDHTIGGGGNCVNGIVEIGEDVASCSSVSDARMPLDVVRREMKSRAGKYDMKGKGQISHRVRCRLRNRKGVGGGYGKYSSVVSYDDPLIGFVGVSSMPVDSVETHDLEYDNKAPKKMEMSAVNFSSDEDVDIKRSILSNGEPPSNPQCVQTFDGDEKNAMEILEQTLEEEHIAHTALYIELEKERNAAATAADEALAMILRLQAEKASIEMEARQYQRMIEEKSAYDAEEMNILKEILVRREKEKHFLEKEVEAYRQMVSVGNEQLNDYDSDKSDDPVLLLHQLSASVDKKVEMENKCSDDVICMDKPNESPMQCSRGEKTEQMPVYNRVGNKIDLQEKEIVSVDNNSHLTSKCLQLCNETIPLDKEAFLKSINDTMLDKDTRVHDIHIVGDATNSSNDPVSTSTSTEVCEKNRVPIEAVTKRIDSDLETEAEIKRSSSETTIGLPPMGPRGLSLLSGLWRSSSSAMDIEMLTIDSEVGRLRERLKIVQEGREKLSISVENWERENIQLKLLEDIARQIEEIRQLSGPEKTARQVSLPFPNSKVLSKKRRSRSVSSGHYRSSEG